MVSGKFQGMRELSIGRSGGHRIGIYVARREYRLVAAAGRGREVAHGPRARAKQAETRRRNALAQHAWDPKTQPLWLTDQLYSKKIQPQLARTSTSVIARHIAVSRAYASRVRQGHRPHERHWRQLAELVGISQ